ncbi:SGNH/GDSL hydrolase family protein [Modestobacter sp. SYSU DS0875]
MTPTAHPARPSAARGVGVIAVLAVLLTGCGPAGGGGSAEPGPAASSSASAAAPATPDSVTVAVVGDSITAGVDPEDSEADPGEESWLLGADAPPLDVGTGWAVPGTTTAQMRDGVTAFDADVLVVMAGTNDLQRDVPWSDTRENLVRLVDEADVEPVVLAAVPPLDSRPADAVAFNGRLADLADAQGWTFIDPWSEFSSEGSYRPGASPDGVHPTPMVAFAVGRAVRDALLSGAAG